ncbi:MAG: enterotoxin [Candidatus Sulfotelmatobacter sp.]
MLGTIMRLTIGTLFFCLALASLIFTAGVGTASQSSNTYGVEAGKARSSIPSDRIILENDLLAARWSFIHGKVGGMDLIEHPSEKHIPLSNALFVLKFRDGEILRSSTMQPQGDPHMESLRTEPDALKSAERSPGQQVILKFKDRKKELSVTWKAILRDGSNYLRQEISLNATTDQPITEIELFDFKAPTARVDGKVKGSPVIVEHIFLGVEHPLSICQVNSEVVTCSIHRELPLRAGQTVTYSSVIGVSAPGQMRRGFLSYIERERARPYSPFLTYNSWYDIGFNNPYDEAAALDVIHSFGEELVEKRNVKLDSFLFDDGWDDPHTLWSFGPGFPKGFTPLKAAAEEYGAAPGVWLSPWGGYDKAKEERLKYGRQQGLETNPGGFALSGPKYFARFREVTLKFIRDYGVNQFKIDGTGNVNSVLPGSQFDSDFQAAISLMREWRSVNPKLFINLTTGTYPSPFWLQYSDSIWRSGDDTAFAGVGSWRERWITYRDAATYHGIVQAGPLFPLNSLMLHGMVYARQAEHLDSDPERDFSNEVHSYFGSGTQLQELYVTHSLLLKEDWDMLAEAAQWGRHNADVLIDTHWIGGDPGELQVYGWAAWSPEKAIITLRNPSDKRQNYALDVAKAFELPQGAPRRYQARSPWLKDRDNKPFSLTAGQLKTLTLAPFEVMNLEATPEK